jgi:hypothetical protein
MTLIRPLFVTAALAAVGTLASASLPSALSSGTALAASPDKYVCMTDDGYGRKRPCSAGYKAANPGWRAGDTCFTDEGNGRYRPCSAGYKAKHAKDVKEPAPKQ